jgi:hypothetical protein
MNKSIDDYNNILNKIAETHKSNQSKFNIIQQNANKEVLKAEKLAADAYAADRAAKDALKIAFASEEYAKNTPEVKADQKEIERLENEIELKIKIHAEALANYIRVNKRTIEIMKYTNPKIAKLIADVSELLKKIKQKNLETTKQYENAKIDVSNYDKKNLDIHQNLAVQLSHEVIALKNELDELLRQIKKLREEDDNNKKIAQRQEEIVKEDFASGLEAIKSLKKIGASYCKSYSNRPKKTISKSDLKLFAKFCLKNYSFKRRNFQSSWVVGYFILSK